MKNNSDTAPLKSYVSYDASITMEDILQGQTTREIKAETIVHGRIVEKRGDGVLVDINMKAEGFLPLAEFTNWEEVKVNDEIDVFLEELENDQNMPAISLQKAQTIQTWARITSNQEEGGVVKGLVKRRVKGGLIVDIMGVEAFLPGSQIDIGPVKDADYDQYVGQEYDFKILKISEERRNIVVSRRELLEESRKDRKSLLLKEMAAGELRKGIVKNITDFGAFVDLGGVDGLLHITDMSWGRISNPHELLEVGQELEVMVLDVDLEKERVSLGLRQKTKDPWTDVDEKYPAGTHVKGHVVNIMPYGAFVELEQGVEGLIHVSEMSWTKRIQKAEDVVKKGDEVEAVIVDVNKVDKKISLSLRQLVRNPWEVLAEKYPKGSLIKGKVRNMTTYGAFVEIENEIDGMIHVSDMSWTRKINHPNEVLKVGEEVEAVILDIDPEQQRISLSIKNAEPDPWDQIDQLYKIGDKVKGKVSKIAAFGAFVELSNKIDGLIHISQISTERVDKVKDKLQVGDEIEAQVIKIDKDERRIGLSIKALSEPQTAEVAADEAVTDDAPAAAGSAISGNGATMGSFGSILGDSLDSLNLDK